MNSIKIPAAWLKATGCCALLTSAAMPMLYADTPVIVVTPARYAQPIEQVGSSVVRLEGEELRQRGIQFVEDALREVPSLIVSSQGARGSQVQLRVRGNEANHVLLLIDGIRVSNASSGEYDLSGLSLSAVDNIEVLLGPQSTLYGSDAIGGVINITTVRGEEGYSGRVGLERGERGIQSLQASVRGASQQWHYALSLDDFEEEGISSASEANGNVEKDPYAKQSVFFRSGYQSDRLAASLLGGSTRADLDFDGTDTLTGQATDETLNRQHSEQDHLSLLIEIPASDQRMQNQLQISRIDSDLDTISADFGEFDTTTERLTAEYRGSFRIDQNNSLQFGLEQIDEELTTESISSFFTSEFAADYEQSGLYLNWLHQYRKLNLSLGARVGDHDGFGRHDDYRVTASYQHSPALRYRAAWGTAYKVPSLQELYGGFGGNPELEPEQSESAEIGIEYQQDSYRLTATYFDQRTTNLIRFQPITQFSGLNENVGRADSRGIELMLKKHWNGWSLAASLSKTEASEIENDIRSDRIRVPEWSAHLMTSYRTGKSRFWLEGDYRDQRRDVRFYSPDGINFLREDVTLDSYTLWTLGASYQLQTAFKLSARIENLTDEDYEEIFSFGTRGRTAIVSADWVF